MKNKKWLYQTMAALGFMALFTTGCRTTPDSPRSSAEIAQISQRLSSYDARIAYLESASDWHTHQLRSIADKLECMNTTSVDPGDIIEVHSRISELERDLRETELFIQERLAAIYAAMRQFGGVVEEPEKK